MKQYINNNLRVLIVLCFISCSLFGIAQEKAVDEILKKTQEVMKNNNQLTCDLDYDWYDTYTIKKPSLSYEGVIIKQNNIVYSKINHTFFLTDKKAQLALKCNEDQKALVVTKTTTNTQQPWELLETFIKQFKVKNVTDKGDHWVCSLTTDVITQLPYGKVEIHIDKKSSLITKQVLYFLSQVPYTNSKGEKISGNPKLEISMSNYKTVLNEEEKITAKLATYIKGSGKNIAPVAAYKKFEIIYN